MEVKQRFCGLHALRPEQKPLNALSVAISGYEIGSLDHDSIDAALPRPQHRRLALDLSGGDNVLPSLLEHIHILK